MKRALFVQTKEEAEVSVNQRRMNLCKELPLIVNVAHRIGLHRTAAALQEAVEVAGFEVAERLEGAAKKEEP